MKWQPTEFQPRSSDALVDFAAEPTTPFAANRLSKPPAKICSRSSTLTEIVWRIICDGFTTWLSISVGSRGPSSQNEHGPKSTATVKERSRPKNMQPSSPLRRIPNAAHITNCSMKLAQRKLTPQILPQELFT